MVEEHFWLALAETARTLGGLSLKHLGSARLSPGLVVFLSSFRTLEELCFHSGFYPHVVSHAEALIGLGHPAPEGVSRSEERQLVDKFFRIALPRHKDNLKYLALCGDWLYNDFWSPSWEDMESIFRCHSLRHLRIPLCCHVNYQVGASKT